MEKRQVVGFYSEKALTKSIHFHMIIIQREASDLSSG